MIDEAFLEILACPACRAKVRLETAGERGQEWIVCQGEGCGLRFPVRDGIPVMLVEEGVRPQPGER